MSVIYFQILQHREGFNFQSCFPNQEPPEQGTAANMHTQEEARVSDATVVSTSVICISSDSWDWKVAYCTPEMGFIAEKHSLLTSKMNIRNGLALEEWKSFRCVVWRKRLWSQFSPVHEQDRRIQGGLHSLPLKPGAGSGAGVGGFLVVWCWQGAQNPASGILLCLRHPFMQGEVRCKRMESWDPAHRLGCGDCFIACFESE